jgi:peroxiredoxin
VLPEFQKHKAELLGISVDGVWCHEAFAKDRRLHFPLLADFESKGVCERALFVIDKTGRIFWSYCSPISINPGADGILESLENLSKS